MKQPSIWVLVLNGTRARILRGLQKDGTTALPELVLKTEHRNLRDIMSEKPGRVYSSAGGGRRSAMEYASDPVRDDERAFAAEVVDVLETHRLAGDYDQLVVFAAPEMLGIIRAELTDGLKAKIIIEASKNLAHGSEDELAKVVAKEVFST